MPKGNQGESRSRATQNRLKMYDQKAKHDKKGKLLYQHLQSKDVSHQARIAPDQRWHIGTRTVNQDELTRFREEVGKKLSSPATYVLKPGKVPFSLLKDVKQVRPRIPFGFDASQVIRRTFFFSFSFMRITTIFKPLWGTNPRSLKLGIHVLGANPFFICFFCPST